MKISTDWLREWVAVEDSPAALGERLTMAGLEVEGIAPAAPEFRGVIVAEIVGCERHPDEKISDEVIFLNKGKQSSLNANQKLHSQHLMLEIDTKITREKLVECLQKAQLKSISYNGGIYIAEFLEGVTFSQVLSQIANDEIPLVYIRDITSSTRRFFVK